MDKKIFEKGAVLTIKFKRGRSIEGSEKDDLEVNNTHDVRKRKTKRKEFISEKNDDNSLYDSSIEEKKDIKKPGIHFLFNNKIGEVEIADGQEILIKPNKDKSFKFENNIQSQSGGDVDIPEDCMLVLSLGSTCNDKSANGYKIVPVKNGRFILLDGDNKPVKIKDKLTISNCCTKQLTLDEIKQFWEDVPGGVIKFFKNNPVLWKNERIKQIIQQEYPKEYDEINKKKHKNRNRHSDNSDDRSSTSQDRSSNTTTNTTSQTKDSKNDKHKHYNDKRSSRYYNQYPYYYQNQQLPMYQGDYGLNYGQQMYQGNNVDNVIGIDGLGEVDLNRPMELYAREPEHLDCFIKTKVQMQKNTYVLYIAGVLSLGAGALIFGLATSIPIGIPIALAVSGVVSIIANVCINASREAQNRENVIRAVNKNRVLRNEFIANNNTKKKKTNVNSSTSQIQPIYIMPQNMIPLQNTNTLQPQQQPQK